MTAMKYANLLEVAEAVFDGRVRYLSDCWLQHAAADALLSFWKWDSTLKTNDHRMWFCLFVYEATK